MGSRQPVIRWVCVFSGLRLGNRSHDGWGLFVEFFAGHVCKLSIWHGASRMAVVKIGPGTVSLTMGVVGSYARCPCQLSFWHDAFRMATIWVGLGAFPMWVVVDLKR